MSSSSSSTVVTTAAAPDAATLAGRAARAAVRALPGLLGLLLVAYGCWLAWAPAGFIAAGALLLADRVATPVAQMWATRGSRDE